MLSFHQSLSGDLFLIYPLSERLYFQKLGRAGLTRPALLSEGYHSDLSIVFYQDELYYSFLDTESTLQLCTLGQNAPILQAENISPSVFSPRVTVFQGRLLLLFTEGKPQPELRITFPFEESEQALSVKVSPGATISLTESGSSLIILMEEPKGISLLRLTASFELLECSSPKEERLSEEKESLSMSLESAKRQYQELMDVATQYRNEAQKWYRKYLRS